MLTLSSGLAYLEEVAVGVAEKAADLVAPIVRRGQELGATGSENLVRGTAIRDPDRHGVAYQRGVFGRDEGHARLVLRRPPSGDQEQPATPEPQDAGRVPVFPVHRGPQDVFVESTDPAQVRYHEDVGQLDVLYGKAVFRFSHTRSSSKKRRSTPRSTTLIGRSAARSRPAYRVRRGRPRHAVTRLPA